MLSQKASARSFFVSNYYWCWVGSKCLDALKVSRSSPFELSFLENLPNRVMHTPLPSLAPMPIDASTASTAAEAVERVAPGPM